MLTGSELPFDLVGKLMGVSMTNSVESHYTGSEDLATQIRDALSAAGKDLKNLRTVDLASVDEFHIRGRQATLELAEQRPAGGGRFARGFFEHRRRDPGGRRNRAHGEGCS